MATSSSSSPPMKYQVFLSFRGEDTRHNFTSYLLKELKDKGMNVFFDEDALEKGELLSPALCQGIAASRLSIIVLSSDYASSKSCLAELSDIMERKSSDGHIVLPIFYHVDPSDVRHLGGSFKNSFKDHELKGLQQVQRWKAAFAKVGELKGWHIEGGKFDRSDTEYIEAVVKCVIKKLNSVSSNASEDLIGIDDQKKVILGLIEQEESRVIGLWGIGGIGKTTLAEAVYNEISPKFHSHCFLHKVGDEIKNNGINFVRNKLVSKVLDDQIDTGTHTIVSDVIKDRLKNKKLIVVLDDVDDLDHIVLMGVQHFGRGSKIIVTSRNRQVLINGGAKDRIHDVKKLNEEDSLQLFSTFAFKHLYPVAAFLELSYKFVHYADGNPRTLKSLGCELYEKPRGEWESEVHKLKRYAEPLLSSFDGLGEQRAIVLKPFDRSRRKDLVQLHRFDDLPSLGSLLLNGCENLSSIPDLSGAINLKVMDCCECKSLAKLPSLNGLTSLESLLLNGCEKLTDIPDLSGAINLKRIDLSRCTSLAKLPCLSDLASLESLHLNWCVNLREIPHLSGAINLKRIDASGCTRLVEIPGLNDLASLESLHLNGCQKLREIPDLPSSVQIYL